MNQLVYLVPLFPLIGFLLNGVFRNYLPKNLSGLIGSGAILVSFVISVLLFIEVKNGLVINQTLFDFISVGELSVPFAFQVDQLSSIFLLIITGVGFLIHLYSTAYMHEERAPHFARYFAYLNLFVFSMLLLVLGSNFVIMFIGWEGVGLCSYLLIGYWFKNDSYNNAAKKAFIMNRIGDFGFLIAIFWMILVFGSTNFADVFSKAATMPVGAAALTGITLLLFLGATGKSAQIPLYTWLPDAMAGPTPVSALIHAATMVTAGIYMIARSNVMYTLAPVTQTVVAIIGLATAILAATIALRQFDIKKVLAYSTVSQLGYMFVGLGVGAYTGAVFHVMTHAFFKALLFLGAGSVIHAMHHEQDIRNMGGLKKHLPITHITFLIGCIAIAGIPPLSGFFSKDEILAGAWSVNKIYWVIGVIGAMMTAWYMFRLYATTFLGKFRGTPEQEHHLHESPAAITIPLIILAILSFVGGWIGIPEVILPDAHALEHFLAPVFAKSNELKQAHHIEHSTELMLMTVSVAGALIAAIIAWIKYSRKTDMESRGFGKVLENKWYVDELYDKIIVRPLYATGKFFNRQVEKNLIDWLVNGIGKLVHYGSRQMRWMQSGQVGSYVLLMVLGMLVFFVLQFFIKK
ncbi:MAG: NADH-quinone oxidoreductase subunit L [Chitinophagaceae bacterium]|nr:NADH-quinone oxidoreductase subunit L [Chitinophagaceae bacterium]